MLTVIVSLPPADVPVSIVYDVKPVCASVRELAVVNVVLSVSVVVPMLPVDDQQSIVTMIKSPALVASDVEAHEEALQSTFELLSYVGIVA